MCVCCPHPPPSHSSCESPIRPLVGIYNKWAFRQPAVLNILRTPWQQMRFCFFLALWLVLLLWVNPTLDNVTVPSQQITVTHYPALTKWNQENSNNLFSTELLTRFSIYWVVVTWWLVSALPVSQGLILFVSWDATQCRNRPRCIYLLPGCSQTRPCTTLTSPQLHFTDYICKDDECK